MFLLCAHGYLSTSPGLQAMTALRNLLEWYWLITLPKQTEGSLRKASVHLTAFDNAKNVFARVGCSLDLPKLHSLQHYEEKIKKFGTPDNFDTEYTENRHIVDAKQPYQKTNKIDYIKQMTRHVQYQMAIELKLQYLCNHVYRFVTSNP